MQIDNHSPQPLDQVQYDALKIRAHAALRLPALLLAVAIGLILLGLTDCANAATPSGVREVNITTQYRPSVKLWIATVRFNKQCGASGQLVSRSEYELDAIREALSSAEVVLQSGCNRDILDVQFLTSQSTTLKEQP